MKTVVCPRKHSVWSDDISFHEFSHARVIYKKNIYIKKQLRKKRKIFAIIHNKRRRKPTPCLTLMKGKNCLFICLLWVIEKLHLSLDMDLLNRTLNLLWICKLFASVQIKQEIHNPTYPLINVYLESNESVHMTRQVMYTFTYVKLFMFQKWHMTKIHVIDKKDQLQRPSFQIWKKTLTSHDALNPLRYFYLIFILSDIYHD